MDSSPRGMERLTRDTLALVMAGGRGSRLGPLTDVRAKPAVPFGGQFRIIDFTLSKTRRPTPSASTSPATGSRW